MADYRTISELAPDFDIPALLTLIYSSISQCDKTIVPTNRSGDYDCCVLKNFTEEYPHHQNKQNGSIDILVGIIKDAASSKNMDLALKMNSRDHSTLYIQSMHIAKIILDGKYDLDSAEIQIQRSRNKLMELQEAHANQRLDILNGVKKSYMSDLADLKQKAKSKEISYDEFNNRFTAIWDSLEAKREKKLKSIQKKQFLEEARILGYMLEHVAKKI